MKTKVLFVLAIVVLSIFYLMNNSIFEKRKEMNTLLLPSLPKPIAKEYALITSAGQSTDAYIVNDIANQLMIHNYFMPQAKESDLEGINTVVLVVGYSPFGEKLHSMTFEEEKKRVSELLEKSRKSDLVVVTVYIGGEERRGRENDELLELICPYTDYLIGTKESNRDGFLAELAKGSKIPLTLVSDVNDISEPLASAFR